MTMEADPTAEVQKPPHNRAQPWPRVPQWAWQCLKLLVVLQILRVTCLVVWGYRDYLPPNFANEFLLGRSSYFFGPYAVAFYSHCVSGPVSLLLGLVLLSRRFRIRFPAWHRRLGRIQVVCVLLFVAPSGFWMALYAEPGKIPKWGFGCFALATAYTVLRGWQSALARQFKQHQKWMERCFVLLSAAVVIRVVGGVAILWQFEADWYYPTVAWASWVVPLLAYEAWQTCCNRATRQDSAALTSNQSPGPG